MAKARSGKERSTLVSILIGAVTSLAVLAVVSLIVGAVVYMMDDPLGVIDIGSLVALLLSGVISSFIISRRTKEKKVLISMMSALLCSFLLLILGAIIGAGSIGWRIVLNYVCYMGVSFIGAWLGAKEGKRRRR